MTKKPEDETDCTAEYLAGLEKNLKRSIFPKVKLQITIPKDVPLPKSSHVPRRRLARNNTSGCKGVSFDKYRNKWQVSITINHKQRNVGLYNTLEAAIAARMEAEKQAYGVDDE